MSDVEQLAEQLRTLGVVGPGPDFPTYVAEGVMASGWWTEHNFEERLWGAVLIPDPDPIDVEAAVTRAARAHFARLPRPWRGRARAFDDLPAHVQDIYRREVRPYVEAALAVPDELDDDIPLTAPDSAGGPTA